MLTFNEYLQEQLRPGFKQLMSAGRARIQATQATQAAKADAAARRQQNTQIGRGFINSLVGSSPTKSKPGTGALGILAAYDQSRQQRGVSFRRTPSMQAGLANATNLFAASNNRLVTDIGTGVRGVVGLKAKATEKLSGIKDLFKPKPPPQETREPMSVSDELRMKLNTGQIPLQSFNPDLVQSQKPLEPASSEEKANWLQKRSTNQPSAEQRRQKYEAEIRARIEAIGNRPGFDKTRSEFERITRQQQTA